MTRFLILPDEAAADALSRAAWTPGPGDSVTTHRWSWRVHPTDGRAALIIAGGTDGALTPAEREALVAQPPGEGWGGPDDPAGS
ncbi:hypothetical protein ACRC7T_14160 [Segnochrobactraceae bacterium EtOH-i3]